MPSRWPRGCRLRSVTRKPPRAGACSSALQRGRAVQALVALDSRGLAAEHAAAIATRLSDSFPAVRQQAAAALSQLGAPGAQALADRLKDRDGAVRQRVLAALAASSAGAAHAPAIAARVRESARACRYYPR